MDKAAERAVANQLMDRYASGDDSAFADLYDYVAPRLHSFLLRQTRDPSRADDVVQQTLLNMHCARRHFSPGAEVVPWAFAIARRVMIDGMRKRKHEVVVPNAEDEPDRGRSMPGMTPDRPDKLFATKELEGRVRDALAGLPEANRVAFELVKEEGLSMAEAAEVLGTTVAAVKVRAHRAYVALRLVLGDVLDGSDGGST